MVWRRAARPAVGVRWVSGEGRTPAPAPLLLPATQRRVVLAKPGPPSALELEAAAPGPAPPSGRNVLVKVQACAVAFRDTLDRSGAFASLIKLPKVLGHEVCGTVAAVGDGAGASGLRVGQRVVSLHWSQDEGWPSPLLSGVGGKPVTSFLGLTLDGGYAEWMLVPFGALVAVPDTMRGWDATELAPVMSTYGTVWQGAVVRAGLRAGERVLVTGASGGVGSASVGLLKALGCHVVAQTSSESKRAFVESLGPDAVVVGAAKLNQHPALSGGVDVVVECTGEPTFEGSLRSLKPEGRLVLVGNTTNAKASLPLGLVILNSLKVIGSDSISATALSQLLAFLVEHDLRPKIDQVLPLEAAAAAHERLEAKAVRGRIVLRVGA
jgi:NADPH:quinone reductase-like Zn-dependent oxidoreductase